MIWMVVYNHNPSRKLGKRKKGYDEKSVNERNFNAALKQWC